MGRGWIAAAAALALCLGACGAVGGDTNVTALLPQIGFDRPIQFQTPLVEVFRGSVVSGRTAILVETGLVQVVPWTEREPYWRFATNIAPNGDVTLPFGARKIISRANARSWSENSVDFFSETLTYNIEIAQPFAALGPKQLGPFATRVTIANDPRVGQWAVQSAAPAGNDEQAQIDQYIQTLGAAAAPALNAKIQSAIQSAYASIEQQLTAQGLIEKDPNNPNIVLRRAGHVALYIDRTPVGQASVSQLLARCDGLSVNGYGKWQIANEQQLRPLMGDHGVLIDTPDRRFWNGANLHAILPWVEDTSHGATWSFAGPFAPDMHDLWVEGIWLGSSAGTPYSAMMTRGYEHWTPNQVLNTPVDFHESILICAASI